MSCTIPRVPVQPLQRPLSTKTLIQISSFSYLKVLTLPRNMLRDCRMLLQGSNVYETKHCICCLPLKRPQLCLVLIGACHKHASTVLIIKQYKKLQYAGKPCIASLSIKPFYDSPRCPSGAVHTQVQSKGSIQWKHRAEIANVLAQAVIKL